jgi:hypothetical protein
MNKDSGYNAAILDELLRAIINQRLFEERIPQEYKGRDLEKAFTAYGGEPRDMFNAIQLASMIDISAIVERMRQNSGN